MMWNSFEFIQNQIHAYIVSLDSIFFCVSTYFSVTLRYLQNDFLNDIYTLKWAQNLFTAWFHPFRLDNLYNYLIADELALSWLWKNGSGFEYLVWYIYNYYFQIEVELYNLVSSNNIVKKIPFSVTLNSYGLALFTSLLKYLFFFVILLNFFFFIRNNINKNYWINSFLISKFSILFETEEELGALDDAILFISFFIFLFSWYFVLSFIFINMQLGTLSFLLVGFSFLVVLVLSIPLSVLLNFGIAFSSYIRGAGSSTNILVEILFDLIGTLVVFTRFVVQNIRFVLIFWAYFELFEWIYSSPYLYFLNSIFSVSLNQIVMDDNLNVTLCFYYLSVIIFGLFSYLYYFLHLLILLLIQMGAYFLISFWLFFFFYTSFYLTKQEKVFFYKRYLN